MEAIERLLTKRQQAELITAIEGRGEVPLKFNYLSKGADRWVKISRQRRSGGGINSEEGMLLERRASSFIYTLKEAKMINVIDIGCGDGTPALPLIREINRMKIKARYVPVDISKELLHVAAGTIRKNFGEMEAKPICLDFETGSFSENMYDLKDTKGAVNLLLFLGSTLGNHSDTTRILSNFRDSMSGSDFLVAGVELTNLYKINKLLTHYDNEMAEDLVSYIPEQIGISKGYRKYGVSWNQNQYQVEMRLTMKKGVTVDIGEESFVLEKDEQILAARSRKFTEAMITSLYSTVGLRTELSMTNPNDTYLLSMVKPIRYAI